MDVEVLSAMMPHPQVIKVADGPSPRLGSRFREVESLEQLAERQSLFDQQE